MPARKKYIGDGVYVEFSDLGIDLTTENGLAVTNRIVLEPETWAHLQQIVANHYEQVAPCDGDHAWPPCASAGCWHREPQ